MHKVSVKVRKHIDTSSAYCRKLFYHHHMNFIMGYGVNPCSSNDWFSFQSLLVPQGKPMLEVLVSNHPSQFFRYSIKTGDQRQ